MKILKNNGVISIPTDTVYGLCSSINSKLGYEKLRFIKNRPEDKSFPIMCSDLKQIKNIAIVNKKAEKLIKEFMPGPITLVLKKRDNLPKYITNGKETIAIRLATSNEIKDLIIKLGNPIFLTSANKSGETVCSSLDEIEEMCPIIDGILEGNIKYSKASTIVDCTTEKIRVLRDGPISENSIISKLMDLHITKQNN